MNTQKSLSGNLFYKLIMFVLTLASAFITVSALIGIVLLISIDGLSSSPKEVLKQQ